ncbi:MAG: hypothetical protein RIS11_1243 [Pseudomonadota bacterium]|jgi:hypothetical protein
MCRHDSDAAMTILKHSPLLTLSLTVDFAAMVSIGKTPSGLRRIAPVTGGTFSGDRLNGTVLPGGNDWVINRADGVMVIDVRLTLQTDDGAMIYLTYQGRFLAEPDAMARFGKGELLDPSEYSLAIVARLECGDPRYQWLNNVIAVGTGEQTRTGPVYSIFAIG